MAAGDSNKQLTWRVVAPDERHRSDMEGHLTNGGYAVLGSRCLEPHDQLGLVETAIHISTREREVLAALVTCDHTKEMAQRLFISEKAVEHHVERLMAKLGVHSRHRLIVEAMRHGLLILTPTA